MLIANMMCEAYIELFYILSVSGMGLVIIEDPLLSALGYQLLSLATSS